MVLDVLVPQLVLDGEGQGSGGKRFLMCHLYGLLCGSPISVQPEIIISISAAEVECMLRAAAMRTLGPRTVAAYPSRFALNSAFSPGSAVSVGKAERTLASKWTGIGAKA
jgi:hypothetical protein